jgi:hypothetical protein
MSRERGINSRSQYPKLGDIDHHQHDKARLPYGSVMPI